MMSLRSKRPYFMDALSVAQARSRKQNILGHSEHGFLDVKHVSVYLRAVSETGRWLVNVRDILIPTAPKWGQHRQMPYIVIFPSDSSLHCRLCHLLPLVKTEDFCPLPHVLFRSAHPWLPCPVAAVNVVRVWPAGSVRC